MARLLSGLRTKEQAPPEPEREKVLRLFVAIELPFEVRRSVVHTMESLKAITGEKALRWVRPEAIHLTLAFLGATPESRVPEITRALTSAVRTVEPFPLAPLGVGSFGGRGRLRVVWIAVGGDGGALLDLAERVAVALVPLGYPRDERAFNGHLTLARVRDDASPEARAHVHDVLMSFDPPAAPSFTVGQISLMESILGPGGSAYRQLATAPLLGAAATREDA
jgi:2'-5' RNA ligase